MCVCVCACDKEGVYEGSPDIGTSKADHACIWMWHMKEFGVCVTRDGKCDQSYSRSLSEDIPVACFCLSKKQRM